MSERVETILQGAERGVIRCKTRIREAARRYRATFLCAFLAGLAAYGFAMLNILNNQDNLANTPGGYGYGVTSGRWFLEALANFVRAVWGTDTLPLFNGLLSVALVALTACLTVSALDIQSRRFSVLIGVLFVTFPSLGMTMLFMFTVGYYAFALLLTLVGVCAAKRFDGPAGIALAAACLTLSLGIYQAYLPIAAALFLLILIRQGFSDNSLSGVKLFLRGLRFLSSLILSLVCYLLIVRLTVSANGATLSAYQEISEMGTVSVGEIPDMIAAAYQKFFALASRAEYAINNAPLNRFAFLASMILSALAFAWLVWRGQAGKPLKALNAVFLLLFPAASFGIILMCYHSDIFGRMAYAAVTVFFLPMILLECVERDVSGDAQRILRNGAAFLLSAILVLTSAHYIWQSNENYMALYYTNRQTEHYFASMVTRIRMTPGYRQDLPLALIGSNISDSAFSNDIYRKLPWHYGGYAENSNYKKAGRSYMASYLGFHQPTAPDEKASELADFPEVRAMPCYPDDGSIRVIDGYLIVKLEN